MPFDALFLTALSEELRPRALDAVPQRHDDVSAVQRQQRDEVEDEQGEVQRREQSQDGRDAIQ